MTLYIYIGWFQIIREDVQSCLKRRLKETKLTKDDCRYLHIVYNSSEMVGQVPTIGQIKTWKWCLTQKATSNRSIKSKACNVFFVYCNLLFWHVLAWGEQVSKSVLRRVAMFAIDIFKSSRLISNGCASSIVYQLINSICVCVRAYMRILYTVYSIHSILTFVCCEGHIGPKGSQIAV